MQEKNILNHVGVAEYNPWVTTRGQFVLRINHIYNYAF